MNTTIRLRIRKELDPATEKKIIRLKGGLIARNFTDIIYFDDDGEDFYIHYFTTETSRKSEVSEYITACIANAMLSDVVMVLG
ncbi:hypothetical protein [Flavobacterium sp. NRK1]|uniref:hypothetical protein n=1 Tax=Flavobacterium sp. NRK1 TaxID=2954929 RepID=UPI002093A6D8|nr:hypothetical protein [Flavobacterium sp. NRK1]MCO6148935.1 hypothetical protein [Flavobacterium sp. NRK1]